MKNEKFEKQLMLKLYKKYNQKCKVYTISQYNIDVGLISSHVLFAEFLSRKERESEREHERIPILGNERELECVHIFAKERERVPT